MNCRCCLFAAVVIAALRLDIQAETAEPPVVLDPYHVNSYLENYSTGNSFSALRVNASLLDTPLSASVITPALLLDQGLSDVNQAMRNVSGVQASVGGPEFQNYYFTRGMPNFYYRDGVRMDLDGGNITPNALALENIEVLKGPSSILYGRGTPGGLVNFNSRRPLSRAQQTWSATAGSHERLRTDLDTTGPLGADFAYRFIGAYEDAHSYRDGVTNKSTYLNPSGTARIGDRSELFLLVDFAAQKLTPDTGIAVRPDGGLPPWVTDRTNFAGSFNKVTPRSATVDFRSTRYVAEFQSKLNSAYQFRLGVHQMRFEHRDSEMAGNMLDSAASGVPGMLGPNQLLRVWTSKHGHRDLTVVRAENLFDFDLGPGPWHHQLLFSIDYGRTETNMVSAMQDHEILNLTTATAVPVWQYFTAFGLGTTKDGQVIYDNNANGSTDHDYALALQDNVKLSDAWRLLWGVRYEEDKAALDNNRQNFMLGATPTPQSAHVVSNAARGRWLPRVGLLFKAAPQVSVFGNYLTSFIPAGATQVGKAGLIAPETGDQLEAGVKYDAIPNRLFGTVSVFQIHRRDIATYYTETATFLSYWKASDTERSSGVEAEITGAVTPALNVVGHLGYLDNEFTGTDTPAKKGRMRYSLAHVTASAWATYAVPVDLVKGLRVGAGVFHSGPQYLDDYNTIELSGHTTCDAMIGYVRARWNAQVNVRNIFNRHYYLAAGNGYNDPGYSAANYNTAVQAVMPAAGTEWQVSVGYAF